MEKKTKKVSKKDVKADVIISKVIRLDSTEVIELAKDKLKQTLANTPIPDDVITAIMSDGEMEMSGVYADTVCNYFDSIKKQVFESLLTEIVGGKFNDWDYSSDDAIEVTI